MHPGGGGGGKVPPLEGNNFRLLFAEKLANREYLIEDPRQAQKPSTSWWKAEASLPFNTENGSDVVVMYLGRSLCGRRRQVRLVDAGRLNEPMRMQLSAACLQNVVVSGRN